MAPYKPSREVLLHGLLFIWVGLIWGLAVPHTPYPRLAQGAHIQFEFSGVLFIVLALILLKLPSIIGPKSMVVITPSRDTLHPAW
jgi:hydroxylaminobenzene mutase